MIDFTQTSFKTTCVLKLILRLTQLNEYECHIFDNDSEMMYDQILDYLKTLPWVTDIQCSDDDMLWNVLEARFIDVVYENKVYLFYYEHGLSTWQAAVILSTFCICENITDFDDEVVTESLVESIETYVVSHILCNLDAGSDFSLLTLPATYNPTILNVRFSGKIEATRVSAPFNEVKLNSYYRILKQMIKLSNSTNEGKPIRLNCIIHEGLQTDGDYHLVDLYKNHFPTNLCSYDTTAYSVDSRGIIFDYDSLRHETTRDSPINFFFTQEYLIPYKHTYLVHKLRNLSLDHQLVTALALSEDGTIFILYSSGVFCYYKNGKWYMDFKEMFQKRTKITSPSALIQTIYDLIHFHHGGCIGLLPTDAELFSDDQNPSFFDCVNVIGKNFKDISQEMRAELVSIDGATLLEKQSHVIRSVAKILPIQGTQFEGGRTSAAKHIASVGGIGIKISEDGYIDVYSQVSGNVKNIFTIGR